MAPVLFSERLTTPIIQVVSTNGTFGRVEVIVVAFTHCADGWNGSACEIQCVSNVCTQGRYVHEHTCCTHVYVCITCTYVCMCMYVEY